MEKNYIHYWYKSFCTFEYFQIVKFFSFWILQVFQILITHCRRKLQAFRFFWLLYQPFNILFTGIRYPGKLSIASFDFIFHFYFSFSESCLSYDCKYSHFFPHFLVLYFLRHVFCNVSFGYHISWSPHCGWSRILVFKSEIYWYKLFPWIIWLERNLASYRPESSFLLRFTKVVAVVKITLEQKSFLYA